MNTFQKYAPEWALRLGFGCMFLYSGIDLIRHPTGWYWAVRPLPWVIQNIINTQIGIDRYLQMQGIGELIFAVIFLAWFLPKWIVKVISLLVVIEMAAILLLVGVIGDTFRDIGLLGGAIALFLMDNGKENNGSNISKS